MKLRSQDIRDGEPIAARFAFGRQHAIEHMALADNLNPQLAWSDAPAGTRSFALLCIDPDVPSIADDVNQEGATIAYDLPRVEFFHWVMIDISADITEIAQGSCSDGVVSGGKKQPPGPPGSRQGLNDYTSFMAGSPMAGDYYGYDGPCPPWNDERLHHYQFMIYALDIDKLSLAETFDGRDVQQAMQGHVLAQADITVKYTLNPQVTV